MRMLVIEGSYFDGKSSKGIAARANVDASGYVLLTFEGGERRAVIKDLHISPRVGSSSRFITYPDGAQFETLDNDAVDTALKYVGRESGLLHALESRLRYIIPALIAVVVMSAWFIRDGVPMLSDLLATHMPAATSKYLGDKTLEGLDEHFFEASNLPAERKERLRQRFEEILAAESPEVLKDFDFRLLFRKSESLGANALALPSGVVVMTDELVLLADHDEELISILAHEVGHVVHRHGLRHMIRNSLLSVLIIWITGDASGASAFIASLPALLINLQYSRDFEREADEYSLHYLLAHDISPQRFVCIMQRLDASHGDAEDTPAFLSTHPATGERLDMFRRHLDSDSAVDCDKKALINHGARGTQGGFQ
ncbi:MAG TPA: M48 family metallopeptidase [Gammaproteobacteria bacterium]